MPDLGAIARALPDVEQGIACAGTALESRTYRTGKKAFLFVSTKDARLRLAESAGAAKKLGFTVGKNGWVKIPLDALPPAPVAKRWVEEGYGLFAGAGKPTKKTGKKRK